MWVQGLYWEDTAGVPCRMQHRYNSNEGRRRTAKGEARTAMAASGPSSAPKALTLSRFPSPVWVGLSVPPAY